MSVPKKPAGAAKKTSISKITNGSKKPKKTSNDLKKSIDVEKNKEGMVIKKDDKHSKMEVEVPEVKSTGDYKKNPVYIYYDWCKRCGICVAFCPTGALGRRPDGAPYVPHPEKCIHCEMCDRLCPDFAITGAKR